MRNFLKGHDIRKIEDHCSILNFYLNFPIQKI